MKPPVNAIVKPMSKIAFSRSLGVMTFLVLEKRGF
jgi:hypothetical protein